MSISSPKSNFSKNIRRVSNVSIENNRKRDFVYYGRIKEIFNSYVDPNEEGIRLLIVDTNTLKEYLVRYPKSSTSFQERYGSNSNNINRMVRVVCESNMYDII